MNKFRKNILLCLILLPLISFSQTDTLQKQTAILVKWTPTALIDPFSSLQFACEFYYNYKGSVQVEYGYMFPQIDIRNSNNRGHRIRLEQRNYFGKRLGWYWAEELNFVYATYNVKKRFSNNWEIDTSTGNEYPIDSYFETINIERVKIGANLKIGYQHIFKKINISIDTYFGLGIRLLKYNFLSYPQNGKIVQPIDNWIEPTFNEKLHFLPDAIVGIKIGYKFN